MSPPGNESHVAIGIEMHGNIERAEGDRPSHHNHPATAIWSIGCAPRVTCLQGVTRTLVGHRTPQRSGSHHRAASNGSKRTRACQQPTRDICWPFERSQRLLSKGGEPHLGRCSEIPCSTSTWSQVPAHSLESVSVQNTSQAKMVTSPTSTSKVPWILNKIPTALRPACQRAAIASR